MLQCSGWARVFVWQPVHRGKSGAATAGVRGGELLGLRVVRELEGELEGEAQADRREGDWRPGPMRSQEGRYSPEGHHTDFQSAEPQREPRSGQVQGWGLEWYCDRMGMAPSRLRDFPAR